MIHGRGRSSSYMAQYVERLKMPELAFVLPDAPGGAGSWYPNGFLMDLDANEPQLSEALAVIEASVQSVLSGGVPAERIVLAGFSQGACLAAEHVARSARRYGALISWTGSLIGPRETKRARPAHAAALQGMPALFTGARHDPWVPADCVESSANVFRRWGAQVELFIDDRDQHVVSDDEIAMAKKILKRIS